MAEPGAQQGGVVVARGDGVEALHELLQVQAGRFGFGPQGLQVMSQPLALLCVLPGDQNPWRQARSPCRPVHAIRALRALRARLPGTLRFLAPHELSGPVFCDAGARRPRRSVTQLTRSPRGAAPVYIMSELP